MVDLEVLARHDHAVALPARCGTMVEFGNHLVEQMDRLEPTLFDDLRPDPRELLTGYDLDRLAR
jgi:hypothetical protein